MLRLLSLVCGAVLLATSAFAIRLQNEVYDHEADWEFLTSFCFLPNEGMFMYNVTYPTDYAVQKLLLYSTDRWMFVEGCQSRVDMLDSENIIELTPESPSSGCRTGQQDGQHVYICSGTVRFYSDEFPRNWYIALARCGTSENGYPGLRLDYDFHMANGMDEDNPSYMCEETMTVSSGIKYRGGLAVVLILAVTQLTALLSPVF